MCRRFLLLAEDTRACEMVIFRNIRRRHRSQNTLQVFHVRVFWGGTLFFISVAHFFFYAIEYRRRKKKKIV